MACLPTAPVGGCPLVGATTARAHVSGSEIAVTLQVRSALGPSPCARTEHVHASAHVWKPRGASNFCALYDSGRFRRGGGDRRHPTSTTVTRAPSTSTLMHTFPPSPVCRDAPLHSVGVAVVTLVQHGLAMGNVVVLLATPSVTWTLGGVTPVRNQVTIPNPTVAAQIASGSARVVILVDGVEAMAG
jgi:hypothetical protein